jgi:hypothetical protein
MACAENPKLSVVLHVGPATQVDEVIARLATDPPIGEPLEVVSFTSPVSSEPSSALAEATALARTARVAH